MVNYNCDICGFLTANKKDYTRHVNTNKHLQKVNENAHESKMNPTRIQHESIDISISDDKNYKCFHCNNSYSTQSNRSKHMKKCVKKVHIDNQIDALRQENEKIQKQALEKEKLLKKEAKEKEKILKQLAQEKEEQYKKQLETYEHLLKSMTTPQTINYFNFINQNYPNAPALEGQESYKDILDSKTMNLVDVITMYHHDNKIVSFIGDYIIKVYSHEEPKNQSIWSTDVSRLTYIISESCKNGNVWSYDKKGSKTKKIIIEPALQYIRDQLLKYCKKNSVATEANILRKLLASNATIQAIDSGELAEKINKYIAPEFFFKTNDSDIKAIVKA